MALGERWVQRRGLVGCIGVVAALQSPVLHADADPFFDELPIVASVSRLRQPLSETPAAVTVIDQEMIRASGMRTVEDLLRLVPGFQVTSHNQDPAIVTYHGLTSGMSSNEYGLRVQVLIDGKSQYSPLFKSGVNWNLLPVALEDIERIEVTRGANTVSYGSNAFLGVVNIITSDPSVTQGWLVSANHGNNGIRDETVRWGGGSEDTKVRLTYRSFQDDGFQKGFYNNAWVNAPDSRQSQLFDLRADYQLASRDELQFSLQRSSDNSQYGRPGNVSTDPLRNLEQSLTSLGGQWRRAVSSDEEYKLRYSYTEERAYGPYLAQGTFTNVDGISVPYRGEYDPGGRSHVNELEFEHYYVPMPGLRTVVGAAGKHISIYSPGQFGSADKTGRRNYRAFGNAEYRIADSWLLNLGGSYEKDSVSGNFFDWRFGTSWHLDRSNTLRFIASRAHRTPSLFENGGLVQRTADNGQRDIVFFSNGVAPERVDSFELGYLGEFKSINASLELRAFIERVPNLVQIVPLALPANHPDDQESWYERLYAYWANARYPFGRADGAANLQRVEMRGYEYHFQWRPFESTRVIYSNALMSIHSAFTDQSRIADSADENLTKITDQTEKSAPRHSQSAMLIQQFPHGLQGSVMYYRASEVRFRRNSPVDPSERFDARLSKRFNLFGMRGELAYMVQMLNESQQGRYAVRVADKLHWLSLSLMY